MRIVKWEVRTHKEHLLDNLFECNYNVIMKATIIQIGNSQGIRIPKPILEQCKLQNKVELEIHKNELVIRSLGAPRKAWSKKFAAMASKGDDVLWDSDVQSKWDEEEWEWK